MIPVLRAKDIRMLPVLRGETTVNADELAELRRKAQAHDSYYRAAMQMGQAMSVWKGTTDYARGWRDALDAFGRLIVEES